MKLDNIKKEVIETTTDSQQKTIKTSTTNISAIFKSKGELKTSTDIQRDSGSSISSSVSRDVKQPLPPGEDVI